MSLIHTAELSGGNPFDENISDASANQRDVDKESGDSAALLAMA